ncbi:MAG: hypothetical protein ACTFAL_07290 [Candidatus Electronema sp. V4]
MGKQAFSFFVRSQDKKLRVVMNRDKIDHELFRKERLSLPDYSRDGDK